MLQGDARGDRALEIAVEIAWRIVAEPVGRIVDQRFGMQDAVVECHGVGERLQGRARRAVGADQIVLASLAEEIRAADIADHTAIAIVDHDDGDIGAVGEIARRFERQTLETPLDAALDEGAYGGAGHGVGGQRHRQMRGEEWQCLTDLGHRTVGRFPTLDRRQDVACSQYVDYPVARLLGDSRANIGPSALG